MLQIDMKLFSPELIEQIDVLNDEIIAFREEGPLDSVSVAKLEEHFKASHIYHSAGIEGNRLTLQETLIVLKEGIDISDKPIKESIEVKNLGQAFDFLKELVDKSTSIREFDIRSIHKLIVGIDEKYSPGEYRKSGVIIAGAEHKPPEPIEIPSLMHELVDWINENIYKYNPIFIGALAHHQLAKIHPFLDGNGRTARLLMNLILMKNGYPICNIKRDQRPHYYDSLSFSDIGLFEPLVEIVFTNCNELFAEYKRIRDESKRLAEWAKKWGQKESEVLYKRESREFELFQSRIKQVKLEFQKTCEMLNDNLSAYKITFYEYPPITFDKYEDLKDVGSTKGTYVFSIRIQNEETKKLETFMFRFFRDYNKFDRSSKVIPLDLNYFDNEAASFSTISSFNWAERVRLRLLYFNDEGDFIVRKYNLQNRSDKEYKKQRISEIVQEFFDDILKNFLNISL